MEHKQNKAFESYPHTTSTTPSVLALKPAKTNGTLLEPTKTSVRALKPVKTNGTLLEPTKTSVRALKPVKTKLANYTSVTSLVV